MLTTTNTSITATFTTTTSPAASTATACKSNTFNTAAATSTTAITFDTTTRNANTTTTTTITTLPKGRKVKFRGFFSGGGELNHIAKHVCWLSRGRSSNVLGTVWCLKLILTGLVVGDVVLTKRK